MPTQLPYIAETSSCTLSILLIKGESLLSTEAVFWNALSFDSFFSAAYILAMCCTTSLSESAWSGWESLAFLISSQFRGLRMQMSLDVSCDYVSASSPGHSNIYFSTQFYTQEAYPHSSFYTCQTFQHNIHISAA